MERPAPFEIEWTLAALLAAPRNPTNRKRANRLLRQLKAERQKSEAETELRRLADEADAEAQIQRKDIYG